MILVTGARGYIGRHVVDYLRVSGRNVTPLSHLIDLGTDDAVGDLTALVPHADTVVHLAGRVDISLRPNPIRATFPPVPGEQDIPRLFRDNVVATANVAEYCRQQGVKHLIFASSQAVYGWQDDRAVTEQSPLGPLEAYGASKVAAEELLKFYSQHGLNVTCLRFPGIYGGDRQDGVVYRWCREAVEKRRITVSSDYPLSFDCLYIDDLLSAIGAVVEWGGVGWRALNIATGEPCSPSLLAHDIASLVPGTTVTESTVPQPVIQLYTDAAKSVLGWKAKPRLDRLREVLESIQCGDLR